MLKDQLELLTKEFTTLKRKIHSILTSKQAAYEKVLTERDEARQENQAKAQIINSWKDGKVVVYRHWTGSQPTQDCLPQLSMIDLLNLRNLGHQSKEYKRQLNIRLQEYTNLETKLEKVRNLIADNQIDKLKKLYKRGEI